MVGKVMCSDSYFPRPVRNYLIPSKEIKDKKNHQMFFMGAHINVTLVLMVIFYVALAVYLSYSQGPL